MNKQSGRIGLYLVLIVMLVAGYFYLNNQVASQSSYSMESMKQAVEDGKAFICKNLPEQRSAYRFRCCGYRR